MRSHNSSTKPPILTPPLRAGQGTDMAFIPMLVLPVVLIAWTGLFSLYSNMSELTVYTQNLAVAILQLPFNIVRLCLSLYFRPQGISIARPQSPGHCWTKLVHPAYQNRFSFNPEGWVPYDQLRHMLLFQHKYCSWLSLANTPPLLLIRRVSFQQYHVIPLARRAPRGYRLCHYSNLPIGWYGAGPDPTFFNETALKNTIVALHAGDYARQLQETRRACPHVVPQRLQTYLHSAGIESPTAQATRHPHPVHYAFESRALRLVARALGPTSWYALWLKASKVNYMTQEGCLPPNAFYNPRYVGKDITRYAGSHIPDSPSPVSPLPVWFAHDTIHHLNPTVVGKWFDQNPTLQYLFATAVIPPETVFDLPTLNPQLYNYTTRGDVLTYIPEGDTGGFYTQPLSARKWLTAHSIVSPGNLCLHVARLDTNHSHHVFVISREQLLPEKSRTMDLANVFEIPWWAHPLASRFERLTLGSLCDALAKYDMRVASTSFRDMYAKIASYAAEVYGHYPATYCRAAAHYAAWHRLMTFEYTATWWGHILMIVSFTFNLPFFTFGWVWQSLTSKYTAQRMDVPKVWEVECSRWVASNTDPLLPGDQRDLCCADLDLYELPPHPCALDKFSLFSATGFCFVVLKFSVPLVSGYLGPLLRSVPPLVRLVVYITDFDWANTPWGLLIVTLAVWAGIRGPRLYFPYRLPPFLPYAKRLLAIVFFLPHAKLPYRTGLSWPYMLSLVSTLTHFAFPKLHPLVFYLDWVAHRDVPFVVVEPDFPLSPGDSRWPSEPPVANDTFGIRGFTNGSIGFRSEPLSAEWGYWNIVFWCHVADVTILFLCLFASLYRFQVPYTYVHDPEAAHLTFEEVNGYQSCGFSNSSPSSETSSQSSSTSASVSPAAVPLPDSVAPGTPFPTTPEVEPLRPATPPPVMPLALPALQPADPFHPYNLPPSAFDSSLLWVNLIERIPLPPNALDPNTMCVWDCIGAVLGADPVRCWASYVSSLDPALRLPFLRGTVSFDDVPVVLGYFGIGYQLRFTEVAGAGCPRGIGAGGRSGEYDPAAAPVIGTPNPGWPTMNAFLEHDTNANTWHCSLRGRPNPDARVEPPQPFDVLGWPSTLRPMIEIAEVLNVPRKIWGQQYARMTGIQRNMFSGSLGVFGAAQRTRAMVLPSVPLQVQHVPYTHNAFDARDACSLATDLHVHPQVLSLRDMDQSSVSKGADLMAKDYLAWLQGGAHNINRPPVTFHLLHGAYGTGKTFELANLLTARHQLSPFTEATLHFHTWDHDLREPLRAAMTAAFPQLHLRAANFKTGCMPLGQPMTGTLVLDDAGKCWNGFIPLLIAMNPGITDIYATFDVCQAQGVFPATPSLSRKATPTVDWLGRMSDYYATEVRRTADEVSDLFGLPRAPRVPGQIRPRGRVMVVSNVPSGVPLLAVSPRFAETQNLGGQVCDTFTSSQGHTIYGDVCVDLGGLSATATEKAAWTALTRATGNIYLLLGPLSEKENAVKSCFARSQVLSALLTLASVRQEPVLTAQLDVDSVVKSAVYNHLARCLSPAASARLGLAPADPVVGSRPTMPAAYRTPWLHLAVESPDTYTPRTHRARFISRSSKSPAFSRHAVARANAPTSVAHEVRHLTSLPGDAILTVPSTTYRLPPAPKMDIQPDPALDVNPPTDDALREVVSTDNANSTFQHITDGPPDALHHVRADKMTTKLGEEKRIRVGLHNGSFTSNDARRLKQLKRGFGKFFDVQKWTATGFNPDKFDLATRSKLASWASKRTGVEIKRSVGKQNLESAYNYTSLFPKGQFVKKQPKWRSRAFACQTVSDFNLGKIFRDCDYAVYLESMAVACAFDSTYMHYRASPDQLSLWYRRHWRPGTMTGNDYTAWDSGVDHVFIEFDVWLLQLCGVPDEYIQKLRFDRYNMHSHLGPHLPRQESGDRYTWILNTLRNAALTGASLDCPARTPLAVSGDDSVTLGAWRKTTGFRASDWIMQPKREESNFTEFCGMRFGGPDVTFDPTVLRWRAAFGLQLGRSDQDYWRSISDAIRETASRLSRPTPMISNAATLLNRAVYLFDLDPTLAMRSFPTRPPDIPVAKNRFKPSRTISFIKFMFFL
uniref:Replication-associated protein n=1 Tax=Diaporthe gulyae deltaflexivirus 1 TaxID=3077422 RepID=A0AA96K9C5_9VIRU|nr:MAG: replication-associated protein [Diaporthe gulyae deltaflexivirus 1]